jgi:hypothetical protein
VKSRRRPKRCAWAYGTTVRADLMDGKRCVRILRECPAVVYGYELREPFGEIEVHPEPFVTYRALKTTHIRIWAPIWDRTYPLLSRYELVVTPEEVRAGKAIKA